MDYRNLIENVINNTNISDFWLCEGIKEYAKQFPKMSEEKFRELMKYDPTYKGGEQLGKYGNWIARLYYNGIKNKERNLDYTLFMRDNTTGINPKTGKPIQRPIDLPEVKDEDLEKIPNLLRQYEALKGQIKKPITMFKDVQDLYSEIEKFKQNGMPTDKRALQRYKTFKECERIGLEKIYEDNQWIIGIPTTLESSVPFGEYCNWCTTSSHGRYYYQYLKDYGGEYYILLNKENGDLYQFHFESNQFMDKNDSRINMIDFTHNYPKISNFLYEYKFKKYPIDNETDEENKNIEKSNQLVDIFEKTKKDFVEFWKTIEHTKYNFFRGYHGGKELKIEGDKIVGQMDIDNLGSIIYDNNVRDCLTNDAVCQILTGSDFLDFYDNKLSDYDYYESDWDEIVEKYGIENVYDWNKLVRIYNNEDDEDSEYISNNILKTLFKNDYARSITAVRSQLIRNGIIDSDGIILQPEELNKLLPEERKVENISEEQKEQIRNIIQDDFFDSSGLLPFLNDCTRYGTEQEAEKDVISELKDELPITGHNIYAEPNDGCSAEFEVSKNDAFKIFYMLKNRIFEDVPNYDDKLKKKQLLSKQQELIILPMNETWWLNWYDDEEEYDNYYDGQDDDWLYLWRVIHGKCTMDDGTYGAFAIPEPYYGWSGFDKEYMKEGFNYVAKKIAKILGRNPKE